MTDQSTRQPKPSPAATEPPNTPEPASPGLDEPMFPPLKLDLDVREALYDREGDSWPKTKNDRRKPPHLSNQWLRQTPPPRA